MSLVKVVNEKDKNNLLLFPPVDRNIRNNSYFVLSNYEKLYLLSSYITN